MTRQESFKARIRARMATTGERYVEARRVLLHQNRLATPAREWVASPDLSDDAIRANTGKGWGEWCDLIDRFDGRSKGHQAIASHLRNEHGVDAWWSQGVTVGYERITGLRLPHQRADGTFTANKSRTVVTDAALLRDVLLDDDERGRMFPDMVTELRSRRTSKAIRLAVGAGVATLTFDERGDGRTKIVVEHKGLATPQDVEEWAFYWSDWLEAVDEATRGSG